MARARYSQYGFTMIELLLTAFIFSVGLLGLLALQVVNIRGNAGGRNRTTANALVEACLSSIQAEGANSWFYALKGTPFPSAYTRVFTGAATTGTFGGTGTLFDVNSTPSTTAGLFTVTWERLDGASDPKTAVNGTNGREFVVTVAWTDQVTPTNTAIPAQVSLSRWVRF